MQKKIRDKFQELFNTEGTVFASPGRINLIGEHIPGSYRQRDDRRDQTERNR